MESPEILVTLVGLSLIAFVLWYFFFSTREAVSAVSSSSGVQEVDITVKGGYSPDVIEVEKGKPVQLHFYRDEEASCSEEVLFPDFGIRRELPAFQTTLIELLPQQAGRFEFTCGMGMLRGSLVVK
ncbi:cupredoxin domain-containing protein [Hymenobacter taeanensis]|uniref:Cupredoxin domain-containing protein n=1 Tax=Hymenobacter taeanensis TaxID=2735321 RepID=A0A6M6BL07_9BACT|nr:MULTISPECIES: cupredoxin domain-containing protein [Hymenobacter]QJX48514.1 cupredoxin domain-containing protein [Hymenobacter taeanensis]UOQ81987.1 cupredoxin domain-containing protein [Hymenobacter sp. 5414T-23]